MNLASIYSSVSSIPLDKPVIYQSFYPLEFNDYIVIHPSSGNGCKNYDYWQEVIDFIFKLNPSLKIVQLGGIDDAPLNRCYHLQGKTTIAQSAYIIQRSKLLIGNDSMLVHMAGALSVPVVAVYGATSATNHGPHWKTNNSILIDSHRDGKKPSFHFNEYPKTVNLIDPEDIVNAIATIINIKTEKLESIHFGARYNEKILESVPNHIIDNNFLPNGIINIRADYDFNLQNIYQQVSMRKCSIYTDKPLDPNVLNRLKGNITSIIYEVTDNDHPEFVKILISMGIHVIIVSKLDDEKLNNKKLEYFDVGIIQKINIFNKTDIKDHQKITSDTLFKTNKLLLSEGKIYLSNAHRLMGIPVESLEYPTGNVLDYAKFYEESDFFYFFNKKELTSEKIVVI
jgi:hypothetical protein